MANYEFEDDLEELGAAEEFLDYFDLDYEPSVVHINRLHILQRYHDYLEQAKETMPEEEEPRCAVYKKLLEQAYTDFVTSDAQTEKVFKVFKMQDQVPGFVSIDDILK